MPNPITHILITIILIELFREYFIKDNRKFPRYYILIAAFAGIIPDLDLLAYYVLYFFGFGVEQIHRTFLHSLFIPLILFLIGIMILKFGVKIKFLRKHHIKLSVVFFIFTAGNLVHLILDSIITGKIIPFYPLLDYSIGLNIISNFPEGLQWMISHTIDVLLLFFWIFWMEFKLKIRDYF
ncbi:hypothetical protein CMI39_01535 [Candidatus Pacearchaeota archaeon]|jgi:membrane-bound metal-dependent hydrolase YbcI (DUF457 family)|nr:hypothetical protein [Candidatus Pacearchaeota archaeon]|tara:strand:- start:14020 stop:14562 length:543 start_codon:yes stop_codon:yes gene_type:complete